MKARTKRSYNYVFIGATIICLLSASYLFWVNKDIKNVLSKNQPTNQATLGNVPNELVGAVSAAGNPDLYTATWEQTKCLVASGAGTSIVLGPSEWTATYSVKGEKIIENWKANGWKYDKTYDYFTFNNQGDCKGEQKAGQMNAIRDTDYAFSYTPTAEATWYGEVDGGGYVVLKANPDDTAKTAYSRYLGRDVTFNNGPSSNKSSASFINTDYSGILSTTSYSKTYSKDLTVCPTVYLEPISAGRAIDKSGNTIELKDDNIKDDGLAVVWLYDQPGGSSTYSFRLRCSGAIQASAVPAGWGVTANSMPL